MARGYTVTDRRRALVHEARRLRDLGLLQREICERMGLRRSTVSDLLSDPWREKANRRRLSYGGTCENCGTPTDGSRGPSEAPPTLCADCYSQPGLNVEWTPERIVGAIKRYSDEHGRQPVSNEWLIDRPEYAPPVSTVINRFGSWSAAIKAAGFETRVGIKFNKKGPLMFKVYAESADGSWRELGEFHGNRQQAVQEALDSLNGHEKPERVMTIHPNSVQVNTFRPVEKVVYELAEE